MVVSCPLTNWYQELRRCDIGGDLDKDDANAGSAQWDASDAAGSLAKLYAATLEKARQQIDWYRVKAVPK
ncbi:MAG: hypothetical protein DMG27_11675 [Acidobacteria bacterium]|nr:MAG: hypothetical protein DMG27_11675 [Acidobacteriota bacterium]